MSDTAHVERALELLVQAQTRLTGVMAMREVYILVDTAIDRLRAELADRMLEDASEEIAGLVDLHGMIDDLNDRLGDAT